MKVLILFALSRFGKAMAGMASTLHDLKQYIIRSRENFRMQEELLSCDLHQYLAGNDHSWDSETISRPLLF